MSLFDVCMNFDHCFRCSIDGFLIRRKVCSHFLFEFMHFLSNEFAYGCLAYHFSVLGDLIGGFFSDLALFFISFSHSDSFVDLSKVFVLLDHSPCFKGHLGDEVTEFCLD